MTSPSTRPHVGIRADASPLIGVGHVVRCLALAEEFIDRGCPVTLFGSVSVGWLEDRIRLMPLTVVPAPESAGAMVGLATGLGVDALVIDGYDLDPRLGSSARAAGLTVLALHDGTFGSDQQADLHLDQNFGAHPHPEAGPGRTSLAGLDYSLFRQEVLDLADPSGRSDLASQPGRQRPHVLAVFGGTDPFGAVEVIAPLVLATGIPLELTCVVARPELREVVEALPHPPEQEVRTIAPTPDVMALAVRSTITVSAAGSSIWELLFLGVPTGIVAVADNQEPTYGDVTRQGVAAPIGLLSSLRTSLVEQEASTATLRHLLTDAAHRRRLTDNARRLVDGRGRGRVADALLSHVAQRPG